MHDTVEQCVGWCREGRPHLIVTVNASFIVEIRRDRRLLSICRNADLVVADGVPVVWASSIVGTPLVERVAGVDLMGNLLCTAASHGLRVYFLGARENVVSKLVELCKVRYPGLEIAGYRNGYFDDKESPLIARAIREARTDILFVGMPTPRKEEWCRTYKNDLGVSVLLGVGGSFDVHAGFISRAPQWLQKIGMEWFWRFAMEPRKLWKRYLVGNTLFVWLTMQSAFRHRVLRLLPR
jgi:N-acetylglucosaminyldiphosphoundecaprenol N-acetyl-beta-D-mannosaminyltransferase